MSKQIVSFRVDKVELNPSCVARHFNIRFRFLFWKYCSFPCHNGSLLRVDVCVRTRNNALGESATTPASRLRDAPALSHWLWRVRSTQPLHQLDNIWEKRPCRRMNVSWQVMIKMSSLEASHRSVSLLRPHWKPSLELRISKSQKNPNLISTFVSL